MAFAEPGMTWCPGGQLSEEVLPRTAQWKGWANSAFLFHGNKKIVHVFKRQPIVLALVKVVTICFVLEENSRYVDEWKVGTISVCPPTFPSFKM